MSPLTQSTIQTFLSARRIAFLGPSRNEKEYSRLLFRELRTLGYEVLPVHPDVQDIDGIPCVPSVADIAPPVEHAILLLSESRTARAVEECIQAGITQIWLYRTGGKHKDQEARDIAARHGVVLITDYCPFLFLPNQAFPHRVHRTLASWFGGLPPRA